MLRRRHACIADAHRHPLAACDPELEAPEATLGSLCQGLAPPRSSKPSPHMQPYIPVSLCGTKEDLFGASSSAEWAKALKDISSLRPGGDDVDDVAREPDESPADLRRRCLEKVLMMFEVR